MRPYFKVLGTNIVYLLLFVFIVIHLIRQIACSPNPTQASSTESPPPATAPELPIAADPPTAGVTAQK